MEQTNSLQTAYAGFEDQTTSLSWNGKNVGDDVFDRTPVISVNGFF
jgi:hypothetical protein